MAKIKIEDIKEECGLKKWKIISTEYINLESELIFECPEGHRVYNSWKRIRGHFDCPICKQNKFKEQEKKIITKKPNVKRVIGLDQATYISGFSIFDNKELIRYGTFETRLAEEIQRDDAVKKWLISMINNWKPDLIGIEDIQMQQLGGRQIYGGDNVTGITTFKTLAHLQGILMEACYELGVPFKLCPTPTWRAHCGVKGKAKADKKKSMQLLVKEWYDISVTNDEADAIGIGKFTADGCREVVMQDWE